MEKNIEKTQKVQITFERNGSKWGMVKDIVKQEFDLVLPNGFDTGVHIIGGKTSDRINYDNGVANGGSEPTNWVTMVAEVVNDRDIEKMVGKVLTIVDATMTDKEQRDAFKSLIKQAMWSSYNRIRERSYQTVNEPPILFGLALDD